MDKKGTTKLFSADLSEKQMIEYLTSFEEQESIDCLSLYEVVVVHTMGKRHISCDHDFCAQGDCCNCNISKSGEYNRAKVMRYCFGDNCSPRGNIIK